MKLVILAFYVGSVQIIISVMVRLYVVRGRDQQVRECHGAIWVRVFHQLLPEQRVLSQFRLQVLFQFMAAQAY